MLDHTFLAGGATFRTGVLALLRARVVFARVVFFREVLAGFLDVVAVRLRSGLR